MSRKPLARILTQYLIPSLAVFGANGMAQESPADARTDSLTLEEVVVTARFRSESVQDIGQSIRAFSRKDIEEAGLINFDDIARRTPGLDFSNGGPGRNTPRVRGISNALFLQDLVVTQPLVSTSINDIPIASPGFNQPDVNLTDISRVEVLRGPQGTLFGEGAAGGAIRYFTTEPSFEGVSANMSLSYLNTDQGGSGMRGGVTFNAPLVEDLVAVRATLYKNDIDGFIDRIGGEKDINDENTTGGRIAALIEPNENLRIKLFSVFESMDLGAEYFVSGDPEDLLFANPGPGGREEDFLLTGMELRYSFGDFELVSITGQLDREVDVGPIWDVFTNFLPFFGLGFIADPVLGTQITETESFTQELRLVSQFDGPFNFTAGVFYRDLEFTNIADKSVANLAGQIDSVFGPGGAQLFFGIVDDTFILTDEYQEQQQVSAFFDLSYQLNSATTIYGGLRYYDEDIEGFIADGLGSANPRLENETQVSTVLPRFSIEYRPNDNALIYASYSEGARNGGFNSPFTASLFPNPSKVSSFDEDEVSAYELGVKSAWLNERWIVNASVYRNDFDAMQIFLRDPILGTALTGNGPDAEITGFELETEILLNEYVTLFFGGNTIEAEFAESIDLGGGQDVMSGDRLSYVPEMTYNLGASLNIPVGAGSVTAYVDYQFVDDRVNVVENQDLLDDYDSLNLRLGYVTDSWDITVFGTNLTNELPILASGLEGAAVGMPRTVGVTLNLRFGQDR